MQSWISSAVILIALFAGFIGLVVWAWSTHQKPKFEAASQLPLEEDHAVINEIQREQDQKVENQKVEDRAGENQAEIRISNDLCSKQANKDSKG